MSNIIHDLLKDVPIPRMQKVRQHFDGIRIGDVEQCLRGKLLDPQIASLIRPGMRIAITGGSRGIDNIALVIRTAASFCKERGAQPFIFPAMGSHGGSTAQGQREICESYGITEEYCGCPILSSMETVEVGKTPSGLPANIDRFAAEADGIIVINRIKAHPAVTGSYESGLMKMMVIGMGKQVGAALCHQAGFAKMSHYIEEIGRTILANAKVLFAIGLLENAYDQTREIHVMPAQEIPDREPVLLARAKTFMPRLLTKSCDVLVIDWMGKNISGSGMDSNITGRSFTKHYDHFAATRVVTLNLTDESHGSMGGVGNADIINKRIFEKGDILLTYPNSITHTGVRADAIPMMMDTDKLAVQCAIKTCSYTGPEPDIIRIKDTLHLKDILVSETMAERMKDTPGVEILTDPEPWVFSGDDSVLDPW